MAPPEALRHLVGFARQLRLRGLSVGTGRVLTYCRAATAIDPGDREQLYWAGRACLVARPDDVVVYDAAFAAWFDAHDDLRLELGLPAPGDGVRGATPEPERAPTIVEQDIASSWSGADEDEEPDGETALRIVATAHEVLRSKSFESLTDEERERVARLIRRLEVRVPTRTSRRLRPAAKGKRFDMRTTLRRSLRTEGEPFRRAWRTRGRRARPLVLLLDVSGSMTPYARALLQFGFAAMAAGRRVEVFCFGTRLTRVTRSLATRDPDRAIREIGALVEDWEGGTRIGESLRALLEVWSQRAALRGAVVVLCSDGLERGEPDVLRAQMARLRRLAHRIVWVNPLKGDPRYEPLARGMAAALPSVDVFLSGHNLESLEELSRAIGA